MPAAGAAQFFDRCQQVAAVEQDGVNWQSFDAVRAGDLIGQRASGADVRAPGDGWLVFPNARALARQEWFYLARASSRFAI